MAKKPPQPIPKTYEEAEKELTDLIADIESGAVGLEESLAKYERGRFLLDHCRQVLDRAQKQIDLLTKGPGGELLATPVTPEEPEE